MHNCLFRNFSKKYIEQLSLRDYIVKSINDLSDQISIAYEKLHFYKDMSLTELLLTFNTSTLNRQREMLTILILSDSKNANLACLKKASSETLSRLCHEKCAS